MLYPAARLTGASRGLRRPLLLVALAALATLLAPCKMVDDQLTDVSLSRTTAGDCLTRCGKTYADSVQVETKRHKKAIRACRDDSACKQAENARFQINIERFEQQARECRENCQHQGGGGGR